MKNCQNCGKEIPTRVVVDGVVKYIYRRNYCLDCRPYGYGQPVDRYRTKQGSQEKRCKTCERWLPLSEFGLKAGRGDNTHLSPDCHECNSDRVAQKRQDLKQWVVQYAGGKCEDCGLSDQHESVYEFHHLDPTSKDVSMNNVYSRSVAKRLISQCVLLCANCHRLRHNDPENPNYSPLNLVSHKRGRSKHHDGE